MAIKPVKPTPFLRDGPIYIYPFKVVPYTSGKILSARLIFLFLWQCV
jgi:hypothetical protein